MELKKIIVCVFMMSFFACGFAQQTHKKVQREKNRIEKQHQIEKLINSREFVFIATRALPQGGSTIDLTTNSNSVKFHPEKIESYMPFFGRAYNIEYGGDGGIKFAGKPKEYNVMARKGGKGFEVNVTVAVTRDNYQLTLFVSPEGSATLTINSNERSTISYYGDISKFEKPVEKSVENH